MATRSIGLGTFDVLAMRRVWLAICVRVAICSSASLMYFPHLFGIIGFFTSQKDQVSQRLKRVVDLVHHLKHESPKDGQRASSTSLNASIVVANLS